MNSKKCKTTILLIGLILLTGCGPTTHAVSNSTPKQTAQITSSQTKKEEQLSETINIIEDVMAIHVPSNWISNGNSYFKDGKIQLYIESADFNEKKLKNAFGYKNEKQCVKRYFYNGTDIDEGEQCTKDYLFPSYRFHATAEKYYKNGNGEAVASDDPIIIQALIDKKNQKIYMMYFTNDMAKEEKVDAFLSKITKYDEKKFYNEESGLYRWQNGASFYEN